MADLTSACRALIAKWRGQAHDGEPGDERITLDTCADELAQVLSAAQAPARSAGVAWKATCADCGQPYAPGHACQPPRAENCGNCAAYKSDMEGFGDCTRRSYVARMRAGDWCGQWEEHKP